MDKLSRITQKHLFLLFSAAALFIAFSTGRLLLNTSFSSIPSVILPFLIVFMAVYWGSLVWMFFLGLTALQTVELERDELRILIGPVVLKRISTDSIKTVGRNAMYGRNHSSPTMLFLVLSDKSPEELNERGTKRLKNKWLCQQMLQSGVLPEGPYAAAKAHLFEHFLRTPLWIEDSEETLEILRKVLLSAKFLV